MPKRGEITKENAESLKQILKGPTITPVVKGEKCEYLDDFYEADMNPNAEGGKRSRKEYDEDEDDEPR